MSIGVAVSVRHIPAGIPLRLSDPVAVWTAQADVTGDATGGEVALNFMVPTGQELNWVYHIDWASFVTDTSIDPGAMGLEIPIHHELANVTLPHDRRLPVPTALVAGNWTMRSDGSTQPFLHAFPLWWRRELGGTDTERQIIVFRLSNNNNLQVYQFRAGGRVYDARIVGSVDFWSLFPT